MPLIDSISPFGTRRARPNLLLPSPPSLPSGFELDEGLAIGKVAYSGFAIVSFWGRCCSVCRSKMCHLVRAGLGEGGTGGGARHSHNRRGVPAALDANRRSTSPMSMPEKVLANHSRPANTRSMCRLDVSLPASGFRPMSATQPSF